MAAAALAGLVLLGSSPARAEGGESPRFMGGLMDRLEASDWGGTAGLGGIVLGAGLVYAGITDSVITLAAGAGIVAALPELAVAAVGVAAIYGGYRLFRWAQDVFYEDAAGANIPRQAPTLSAAAVLPRPLPGTSGIGVTR